MIPHLVEEEDFYLQERAYYRMVARKYPSLKEQCETNEYLCIGILLNIKQQIRDEHDNSIIKGYDPTRLAEQLIELIKGEIDGKNIMPDPQ